MSLTLPLQQERHGYIGLRFRWNPQIISDQEPAQPSKLVTLFWGEPLAQNKGNEPGQNLVMGKVQI